MTRVPVSIVVPARNEAARIAEFIRAHDWAAECIVVDNGSTDATAKVAEAAGARVLDGAGLTIGVARNLGIEAATEEWVLSLDCDEVAEPALADELRAIVAAPQHDAFRIRRRNRYLGREQTRGTWGRDWVLRFARKRYRYDTSLVHEQLVAPSPHGDLRSALWHEPYRDLSHHLAKMDQYAQWGAEALYAKGRRAGVFDLTLRPAWRFVKAYFLTGHCLDGRFGLVTSLLGAQTAFLKYAHLWAIERARSARPTD